MKPYIAVVWIILAVVMLIYLIYHNIKMTRVLRTVLEITESSRGRCEALLGKMKSCLNEKEQKVILKELDTEEKKMNKLFASEKEWPGQGKRIKEHLKIVKEYRITAKKTAERNKLHV